MSASLLSSRSVQGCRHVRPAGVRGVHAFNRVTRTPVIVRAEAATGSTVGPKKAVEITSEDNFKTLVLDKESDKLVLVDFWAPWCGPCRMISGVLDELAESYKDKIVFAKLNTDQVPEIASKYNIRSIPTVMFFKKAEKMEAVIGAVGRKELEVVITKYL